MGKKKNDSQGGANPVSDLLARLEKWLGKNRRHYLAGLLPGANAADLKMLADKLGKPVPWGLRSLLSWHNGQREDCLARFEQDWLLLGCREIAAAKPDLDRDAASTGWNPAWIPFLDNDAGDFLCLDSSQTNEPVRAFWLGKSDHAIVAPALAGWLKDFVDNVEKGNYVEDPERGSFLRKAT